MPTQVLSGLIGHGISRSLTPALHEQEAKAQGFECRYRRFDTATPEYRNLTLDELLVHAEELGLSGVNVTHPYKVEATELCDTLSNTAADIGAVNTIVFDSKKRIGHNTDCTGFRSALRRAQATDALDNVLQFGAGGAGNAVAFALIDEGCKHLVICDPAPNFAEKLARKLKSKRSDIAVTVQNDLALLPLHNFDGVVNATPLGMNDDQRVVIQPETLARHTWVADIVYFPLETELLRRSRAHGLATIDGSGMAVFQAVKAFELFTGRTADVDRMVSSFQALLPETPNSSAILNRKLVG